MDIRISNGGDEKYYESWDSTHHTVRLGDYKTFEESWSLSENGYVKFSNRVLIQWFYFASNNSKDRTKNLPTSYSKTTYSVFLQYQNSSGYDNTYGHNTVITRSLSSITFNSQASKSNTLGITIGY